MSEITLTIDGKTVTVPAGTTVIQAATTVGIDIPRYCYHPGLSVDGNCRMCLVEIEKMPKPMIACRTQVAEGMSVLTQTDKVKQIRRSVMEFQLVNHPLDCPTCDQAGECKLQDYYMQHDMAPSRFQEEKQEKGKMIDLGSDVMLDQERCIACTRCIRVCKEVAKQDELALANRGDHVTITTFPGKKLSNPYAGNVVDVCPVGALTNKDFRYKKRVWFLSTTPSICTGCSRGCSINMDHVDSQVYRFRPRYSEQVNKYWMCDEGRYSYRHINDNRLLKPTMLKDGEYIQVSFEEAIAALVKEMETVGIRQVAVVGHASASTEVLSLLKKFTFAVLKNENLYASRYSVDNPSADDILRTADKNPNQKSIEALGYAPLSDLTQATGVLVLQDLSKQDLAILKEKKIPILGLWTSHQNQVSQEAKVVFPIPTYAEQAGHFTNVDGVEQAFEQAFEPRGESKPLKSSLTLLGKVIN